MKCPLHHATFSARIAPRAISSKTFDFWRAIAVKRIAGFSDEATNLTTPAPKAGRRHTHRDVKPGEATVRNYFTPIAVAITMISDMAVQLPRHKVIVM